MRSTTPTPIRGPGRGAHQRGSVFCAGANLSERSSSDAPAAVRSPQALFGRSPAAQLHVGRIAGHCAGQHGGRRHGHLAEVEDAKFGFTEVRWGGAGGHPR